MSALHETSMKYCNTFILIISLLLSPLTAHAEEGPGALRTEDDAIEAELEALTREAGLEERVHEDDVGENEPEVLEERGDLRESEELEEEVDPVEAELEALGVPAPGSADARPAAPRQAAPAVMAGAVQSMNPDLSFIADFALSWFSDEPSLVGGHDPTGVGFNLQQLELAIGASVDPYFRFDANLIFTLFGVELEEAYGTTLMLPAGLQLRAGQFLTRFGRSNPTHLHAWRFVVQPLAMGKFFGGEGLRGLGVEVSQLLPLPWFAQWTLSTQNVAGGATGRSFLGSATDIESLLDLTLAARLEQFFELPGRVDMLWGLSGANGPNSSGRNNRTDIYGTDILFKYALPSAGGAREIGWQTEALLRRRQAPGAADAPTGTVLQDFGLYSELYYSPSLQWQYAGRYEYVSGVARDYLDPDWDQDRQRIATNVTYFPSHFSRLRLEYAIDVMPYRDEATVDQVVHMVFLQLELLTGAHGAHRY